MIMLMILMILLMAWFLYMVIKYRNPYKLIMVFGKKGCGKTTYLTKLAQHYLKKGRPVYSTEYVAGTYKIEPELVGMMHFPPESVILMDEVGMCYDNRNFKNFRPEVRDYFKLQRHYRHTVYLFSQTFDVDLKLRNLTDKMYMLVNYFGFLTVGKEIKRKLVVVKPSEESESRIADELIISPLFLAPFGARIFIYIPHWIQYFDSHAAPRLRDGIFPIVEYPDGFRRNRRGMMVPPRRQPKLPSWRPKWRCKGKKQPTADAEPETECRAPSGRH